MALEHSVLNEQIIIELLKKTWGKSVVKAEKMPLGSANCYCVSSEKEQYFLKEFQSSFQIDDLTREVKLTKYLLEHGIPTTRFIPTISGKMYLEYQGHCICLEEYIEGTQFDYSNFPKEFLKKEAAMLGKIHQCLSGYDLPIGMDEKWVNSFSVSKAKAKYDELLGILEKHKMDNLYDKIKEELRYKKDLQNIVKT